MAQCHQALSHYLNQCWQLISEVLWHSPESIFIVSTQATILYNEFENYTFLTHLPLDKMAAILSDDIFICISVNENDRIPIKIPLKFVPMSPINNKLALAQVMAWHWTGDKPLLERILTQFIDAYMWH